MRTEETVDLMGVRFSNVAVMNAVKEAPSQDFIDFSREKWLDTHEKVRSLDLPVHYAVVSKDVYMELVSRRWFMEVFDPVTDKDMMMTGRLGNIYGAYLLTDVFFHPLDQVFGREVTGMLAFVSNTSDRGRRIFRTRIQPE